MMNKREAIQAMLDGKKVRERQWHKDIYIFYDDDKGYFYNFWANGQISPVDGQLNCFNLGDHWELYEEPKPKKKLTFTRPKWAKFYERLNTCPEWMSTKEAWLNLHSNPITSDEWETMEIEVEE